MINEKTDTYKENTPGGNEDIETTKGKI